MVKLHCDCMPNWRDKDQVELMTRLKGLYVGWEIEECIVLSEDEYNQRIQEHSCDLERWMEGLSRKSVSST